MWGCGHGLGALKLLKSYQLFDHGILWSYCADCAICFLYNGCTRWRCADGLLCICMHYAIAKPIKLFIKKKPFAKLSRINFVQMCVEFAGAQPVFPADSIFVVRGHV